MRVAGDGTRLEIDRTDIEAEINDSSSWITMTPDRGVIGHGTTDLIRRQLDWMDTAAPGMVLEFSLVPIIHRERALPKPAEARVERQHSTATSPEQPQGRPPAPPAGQPDTPKLLVTITRYPSQSTATSDSSQKQQGDTVVEASTKEPTEANNTGKLLPTRRSPRGRGTDKDNTPSLLGRPSRARRPGSIREPGSYALPGPGSGEESDSSEFSDPSDEAQALNSAAPTPEKNTGKGKDEPRVHNTRRRLLSKSQLSKNNSTVNERTPGSMSESVSWPASNSRSVNHWRTNRGTDWNWPGVVRPARQHGSDWAD